MSDWYLQDVTSVLRSLKTDAGGLTTPEANQRLSQHGKNELIEQASKSSKRMLWEQFTATPVLLLIAAAAVSAYLQDYKDMIAILAIVLFNALLGFNQEYRASQAFAALKKLAVPKIQVRRDDRWQNILSHYLVPGDIIMLEAGGSVPADSRLLESINLQTQEATFTGESLPVEKTVAAIAAENQSLGDRHNMAYMGTLVTYGRGLAVVTATGMETELGKIAQSVQAVEQIQTPLQRRLDEFGRKLASAILILVGAIFAIGLWRGENLHLMILTAVSIAVAAIPEGLPAIVTITLAIGSYRMLKRQALIRKLPAVETLGSITTICSDKTGTLTENRMKVTAIDLAGHRIDLTTKSSKNGNENFSSLRLALMGATLCNNATLAETNNEQPMGLGDPTEVALLAIAHSLGLQKSELERQLPRILELPFDSDRRRMTSIHEASGLDRLTCQLFQSPPAYLSFTKGSVGSLLKVCNRVWHQDRAEPLNPIWRERIEVANDELAAEGMRVLGIAFLPLERLVTPPVEHDLIFIGMLGMLDPARPEIKKAVEICKQTGIRPIMITGDHPLMASRIAQELGIANNDRFLTGQELSQLSPDELQDRLKSVSVYARVTPKQKLIIVEALQKQGQIVAMTGDGVNDAPALRKANIGIAMGITGTDVSKEAADMVLLDDNFATIVAAVEEGRVIYTNIRKFLKYSMTGNASGIWVVLLAPFLGIPLPLLPLQILWINLQADGILALALSVEPAERNVMQRLPYRLEENIFRRGVGRDILWVGLLMGIAFLGLGYYFWSHSHVHWQTMVFSTLTFSRASLALAMRSEWDSIWTIGLCSNRPMLAAVTATSTLQVAVIYLPWLQQVYQTYSLTLPELGICLLASTVGFCAIEIEKWWMRHYQNFPTVY